MRKLIVIVIVLLLLSSCQKTEELTKKEIETPIQNSTTATTTAPTTTPTTAPTDEPIGQLDGSGGGLIVFDNEKISNYDYELYIMNADGSALTKLTDNPAFDGGPSFSPDAKKIVFNSTRNGNMDIYIFDLEAYMNGQNAEPIRLTNEGNNYCPDWAPDNSAIMFTSDRDGGYKIYKMNIDGSDQELFIDLEGAFNPNWSADSKKIVFNAKADGNSEIFKIDANGENMVRLTIQSGDDQFPAFSPDGETIAFSKSDVGTHFSIGTIDKNGENLIELVASYNSDEYPTWSPDGEQILCRSSITGSDQLIIMDKDGSNIKAVTNMRGTCMDNDWIAYQRDSDPKEEITNSENSNMFTIMYTVNGEDYKEIPISTMDSFYKDDTWYVNYKDLGRDIGSFRELDVDLVYESGVIRAVFPAVHLDHAHILTKTDSGKDIQHPLADRIDRDNKIYIPIEKLLGKINNVEYSDDRTLMRVIRINKMAQVIEKVNMEESGVDN